MSKTSIDDLRATLSHARSCHEAWWIIEGDHPTRDSVLPIYNRYSDFFGVVHSSLFVTFIVKLASVFDERSDCISLKILPAHIDFCDFDDIWASGRILYRYRNKVIAHRDLQLPGRNFAAETGFTYNGLKKLLDDSCAIFDFCADRMSIDPTYRLSCDADLQLMAYEFSKKNNV